MAALEAFCKRWRVTELALFGSALREDFGPESDIDLLVTFDPEAHRSLFDLVHMEKELGAMLGRGVDLVSRRGIEQSQNWIRREEILSTSRIVYAA